MEILEKQLHTQRFSLYTGGVAAILASICCFGPFLLVAIGLSSATILYLITAAEWSRAFFILVALIALIFSYRSIWNSAPTSYSVEECSIQKDMTPYKVFFIFVTFLITLALMLPYIAIHETYNL